MRVIQHNCRKTYAVTIAALEAGLDLQVEIVCLQEPYIDGDFRHGAYAIYWPEKGERRDKRVAIAVRRDLLNRLSLDLQTDLVNHPYIMAMDVWDLDNSSD